MIKAVPNRRLPAGHPPSATVPGIRQIAALGASVEHVPRRSPRRIAAARDEVAGMIVFTTSFRHRGPGDHGSESSARIWPSRCRDVHTWPGCFPDLQVWAADRAPLTARASRAVFPGTPTTMCEAWMRSIMASTAFMRPSRAPWHAASPQGRAAGAPLPAPPRLDHRAPRRAIRRSGEPVLRGRRPDPRLLKPTRSSIGSERVVAFVHAHPRSLTTCCTTAGFFVDRLRACGAAVAPG